MQEDVKSSLLLKEDLARNAAKVDKLKSKRKLLVKDQEDLEAKRGKLSEELKELEDKIAAGRRGEEVQVDVSFPDLLGDDSGINDLLVSNAVDQILFDDFDLTLFNDVALDMST